MSQIQAYQQRQQQLQQLQQPQQQQGLLGGLSTTCYKHSWWTSRRINKKSRPRRTTAAGGRPRTAWRLNRKSGSGVLQPVTDTVGNIDQGLGKALDNIGGSTTRHYDPDEIRYYRQKWNGKDHQSSSTSIWA
jgi:hypothetical protein